MDPQEIFDRLRSGDPFRMYSPYHGKYAFPRSHAAKDGTRYVELHGNSDDRTTFRATPYGPVRGGFHDIYYLL
ncbi:hypothetical protein [Polyangium spumosum]|uniref:Uncharacterized protein n=1 Tax=Polyangium spumosum TaxID=889282 RepID=A0A6N7PF31_9BACT|nr:hypothetical protein [Polyangium spumosum]MRG90712.1 hypothetical protein [Polyangium spumosum]